MPRAPEAERPDLHRGPARHRERRQARGGAPEGRAEGREVRGDVLEILPAPGPRPGGRDREAREQRVPLREAEGREGPRHSRRGLPGPHAGGAVRAQRPRPQGDYVPRREARVHPRRIRDGAHGDEAPRPRGRDGRGPREGDGEARGRILPRGTGGGDRRRERARPRAREAHRRAGRVPHGGDERVLRGPKERAGGSHRPDEGSRRRGELRTARGEGEADRPDQVEAPRGGGPAGGPVEGRPRVHRIEATRLRESFYRPSPHSARIPPMTSDRKKTFLEGFEAGLRAAWNEVIKMASRGYSSTELGVMSKTRLATLHRDVEAEAAKYDEDGGVAGEDADEIADRGAYILNEEKADAVYGHFRTLVKAGARGRAITRTHPADVTKRFQLGQVASIWLSRTPGKAGAGVAVADPSNLVSVAGAGIAVLGAGGEGPGVLPGLAYPLGLNRFSSLLPFVPTLYAKSVVNDSYLLISANAGAMKEQEYNLLAKEMAGELLAGKSLIPQ